MPLSENFVIRHDVSMRPVVMAFIYIYIYMYDVLRINSKARFIYSKTTILRHMHENHVCFKHLKRAGRCCFATVSEKVLGKKTHNGEKNFEYAASNGEYWYSSWRFDTMFFGCFGWTRKFARSARTFKNGGPSKCKNLLDLLGQKLILGGYRGRWLRTLMTLNF